MEGKRDWRASAIRLTGRPNLQGQSDVPRAAVLMPLNEPCKEKVCVFIGRVGR
jgi:hypothetical protein